MAAVQTASLLPIGNTAAGIAGRVGHVRIAWIIYFVSFAIFAFTFHRAADRLAGPSPTRAPLRQSMKLWLLVPLVFIWPLGVLVWDWLVRQYVEWAYDGGAA